MQSEGKVEVRNVEVIEEEKEDGEENGETR